MSQPRAYHYRCDDRSLLGPWMRARVFDPTLVLVPRGIPANLLTLAGSLCFGAAVWFARDPGLAAAFLAAYLFLDHWDGSQAKRTGTGSALGEFIDHYLDTFHNGMLAWLLYRSYGTVSDELLIAFLAVNYLAHAAVAYQQFRTGWMVFERVSALESVVLVIALLAVSAWEPAHAALAPLIPWGMALSCLGGLLTLGITLHRLRPVSTMAWGGFAGIVVLAAASALWAGAPWLPACYGCAVIAGHMRGHLVDGIERRPDQLSWVLAWTPYYGGALATLWLAAVILRHTVPVLGAWGHKWVWWNPD